MIHFIIADSSPHHNSCVYTVKTQVLSNTWKQSEGALQSFNANIWEALSRLVQRLAHLKGAAVLDLGHYAKDLMGLQAGW